MSDKRISVIERWALVAGVTGVTANMLLIALYVLDLWGVGDSRWGDYGWTGPANDVIGGIVSTGATIPVAVGLGLAHRGRPVVRWATLLAAAAMAAMVGSSVLLVADVIPFERQVFVAMPAIVIMFGWTAVIGRDSRATGLLPPRLARWAVVIGAGGALGMVVASASLLLPWASFSQYVVGGVGLLLGIPAYLAFPMWLIVLSGRLRAHLSPSAVPMSLMQPTQ